jgi:hypothetical protein
MKTGPLGQESNKQCSLLDRIKGYKGINKNANRLKAHYSQS